MCALLDIYPYLVFEYAFHKICRRLCHGLVLRIGRPNQADEADKH